MSNCDESFYPTKQPDCEVDLLGATYALQPPLYLLEQQECPKQDLFSMIQLVSESLTVNGMKEKNVAINVDNNVQH